MNTSFKGLIFSGLFICFTTNYANGAAQSYSTIDNAVNPDLVNQLLQDFDQNSFKFMNSIPAKKTLNGKKSATPFSGKIIKAKDYILIKNEPREKLGRSAFSIKDDPRNLVDNSNSMITSLQDMDTKQLLTAHLDEQPWSDTYWPLFEGNIAWRYGDSKFPASKDWLQNYNYVWLEPVLKLGEANPDLYDNLSPAEKYDLLIGDSKRSLTKTALNSGKEIYAVDKKVEDWMGICHGWAPASFMVPRPKNAITVTAVDGQTKINFYPSDLKALSSFVWANSNYNSKFIGGRCNVKTPNMDSNGRIIDANCFDTNPGTWHMTIVNQIGIAKRSFVIDATYDYEVWNQPVYSYSYTYFNPITRKAVNSISEASVNVSDFKEDKFAKYRSPNAITVVGIAMELTYMSETEPSKATLDSASKDLTEKVTYLYDLELNAQGNIVGGEWYQNAHPDFLWTPNKDTQLYTNFDKMVDQTKTKWDGVNAFPEKWQSYAQRASANGGIPLPKIIDILIQRSNAK